MLAILLPTKMAFIRLHATNGELDPRSRLGKHSLGFEWHRLVAGKTLQTGKLNIDFQIKNNPSN